MFRNCKQLDDKHAPVLPTALVTVAIYQDASRDTSGLQHTMYFCFNTFFERNIVVDLQQLHHFYFIKCI